MPSIISATTTNGLSTSADNSGSLQLATNNGTTAVTIDTSQNVGIGTSSPDSKLHVKSTVDNTTNGLTLEYDVGTAYKSRVFTRGNNLNISADTGNTGGGILFLTAGGTERASITSGGTVLLGTTSTSTFDAGFRANPTGTGGSMQVALSTTGGGTPFLLNTTADTNIINFYRSSTNVGTISVTTTATAYNTSSDYRLKENIAPMTGALAKIAQLKPVTYTWKSTGETSQGFIAHELQAVVPDCVTGEKDAIDEEGNPKYQGIDTSFLVATLTAAIQELKAELDATKAEVQALKGVA
jgi:hypothetical protein